MNTKGERRSQYVLRLTETLYDTKHVYAMNDNGFLKKFGFVVRFNSPHQNIICDSKKYTRNGITCCYCLSIFNVHCVLKV